jgi:hypothetical protein
MPTNTIDLQAPYKDLLTDDIWNQLVAHLRKSQPQIGEEMAERAMDQAIAFMLLISLDSESHSPSHIVDLAWHTFVLHTREYANFCEQIAGRFIHHAPELIVDDKPQSSDHLLTPIAMLAVGIQVDSELWSDVADCNSYCSGDS